MRNIKRLHPGIHIKRNLEAMEMTAKEFANRTGISERTLSSIINGIGDITFDVANKLSIYFDNSIEYWINLQTQYNVYINELENEKNIENEYNLLKKIKKYALQLNFINENDSKYEMLCKCKKEVGVNSLQLLTKKDSFVCLKEQNTKIENDCFLQNFWIALALNKARKKETKTYNQKLLKNYIQEIRSLSLQKPDFFIPRLNEIFEECGISFVLLPYLSKSNIYGATKWFSKDNVMLAISNRGKSADLFWFTLFHEISHVLMQHRREILINMNDNEDEADKNASEMLINSKDWNEFIKNKTINAEDIDYFSKKIGIHPCIVLGRLHKEKIIPYNTYNDIFNIKYEMIY